MISEMYEWDSSDWKALELNAKAMHILFTALKEGSYKRVSICNSLKEIWEKLESLYGEKKLEEEYCEKESSTSDKESNRIKSLRHYCEAKSSSCKPCSSSN
ncbi:Uncharacterized protein TCM_039380 [Theobroma cacao]|uniref:Uncharacterized protein n=1 Tax=Theobroma cacao TaxID=3641 RepID=A0A061GR46_THECC|nr:Uncharacterized protein TCM_039380 [Theobroma cacao]